MSLIKGTVCYMLGVSDETLDRFVGEIKSFLAETGIPETYAVNVYKDRVTCCGYFRFGVAFEIIGPKMQLIGDLNKRVVSRIKEICKRESVECQECEHDGILLDVGGSVFAQDETIS